MKKFFPILALLSLSACAAAAPPKDEFFRVAAPQIEAFAAPALKGRLIVERLKASGVIGERAIAYRDAGDSMKQYAYVFWAAPPAELVSRDLADSLGEAGVAEAVAEAEYLPRGEWRLDGRLVDMAEERRGADRYAVISVTLALRRESDGATPLVRSYRAEIKADSAATQAVVHAFDAGIADIAGKLRADIAALKITR